MRPERDGDHAAVRAVHEAAFPTRAEADLVDRLRDDGDAAVSLVAERRADARVVGHILFSPVTIVAATPAAALDLGATSDVAPGLGLAPLAVLPAEQRRGVGGALVRAGIRACAARGAGFVVVLGHADYYPRFGFVRASTRGLGNEYGADASFFVLELTPGALPASGGVVRYAPAFAALGD